MRSRKTKLPEKKQQNSGSGPLRVTPDILANARANLRKSTTRKRKTKKSTSNNPLGITVDILKNMRSGLRRTKRRQRKLIRGGTSSLTAMHPGVTVEKLRTIVLNKVNRENKIEKDYSGTTALRRHMSKIRLRKTSLLRSPGGTPLTAISRASAIRQRVAEKMKKASSSPAVHFR